MGNVTKQKKVYTKMKTERYKRRGEKSKRAQSKKRDLAEES